MDLNSSPFPIVVGQSKPDETLIEIIIILIVITRMLVLLGNLVELAKDASTNFSHIPAFFFTHGIGRAHHRFHAAFRTKGAKDLGRHPRLAQEASIPLYVIRQGMIPHGGEDQSNTLVAMILGNGIKEREAVFLKACPVGISYHAFEQEWQEAIFVLAEIMFFHFQQHLEQTINGSEIIISGSKKKEFYRGQALENILIAEKRRTSASVHVVFPNWFHQE